MSKYNKWIIWGCKNSYNTFGHVQAAYERALRYLGKNVQWLDHGDNLDDKDLSNAIWVSMNCVTNGMPLRKDGLYFIHNAKNDSCMKYLEGMNVLPYGVHIMTNRYEDRVHLLGPDIYFDKESRVMSYYWGTDLLPHEIEANKPTRVWNPDSKVFNYVGTVDPMKRIGLDGFLRACKENGIEFKQWGGYSGGPVVSIEDHIRLIRESYITPAFQGADQVAQGYMSCRIFKNLSYGVMSPVHSIFAHKLFGEKTIFNDDTYQLFYQARERLQNMGIEELHEIMDYVAQNHTYLNKISGIEKAIEMLED